MCYRSKIFHLQLTSRAEPVEVHPDFRLIGCMNPGGSAGKTELTSGVRSRLRELWAEEVESEEELGVLAEAYLSGLALPPELIAASLKAAGSVPSVGMPAGNPSPEPLSLAPASPYPSAVSWNSI
mgnify:CR=1 FL=1